MRSVVIVSRKLEKVIEGERKKRMEIDEKVNFLMVELEKAKNVREKVEVEARILVKGNNRSKKGS